MDKISSEARSKNMSRIKGKNTKPEMWVRSALHSLGYRFRLHYKLLNGRPDIVLPKYKLAVFVHGCFWHRHSDCNEASKPKSNSEFWEKKLNANVERDRKNEESVRSAGWNVLVIWECELRRDIEYNKLLLQKKLADAVI